MLTRWRQGRRVLEEALSKLGAERSGEHYEVDSRNALAVLDGGWIALGPKSQIREISSRGAKARNRALRPAVRAARTRADVWAAAVLPAEGREELRREPETKELASMELAIGSASVGRRISLRGRLQFSDPASGSRAAALMKTAPRELAAERDIKRAGFDQVLSGASIRARGRSVRLSARMSNEQLRALQSYLVGSAL